MLVQLWLQLWPPEKFPSWTFAKNEGSAVPRPRGQGGYSAKDPYKELLGKK